MASREVNHTEVNHFTGILREDAFLGEYLDCQVEVGSTMIRVFMPPHLNIQRGEMVGIHLPGSFCTVIPHNNHQEYSHPASKIGSLT